MRKGGFSFVAQRLLLFLTHQGRALAMTSSDFSAR